MKVTYSTQDLADAYTFLVKWEGKKQPAYLDTATPQQITIGVGSNIQGNKDARKIALDTVVPELLYENFLIPDGNGNMIVDQLAADEFAQYRGGEFRGQYTYFLSDKSNQGIRYLRSGQTKTGRFCRPA